MPRHLLSIRDLTRAEVEDLLALTDKCRRGGPGISGALKGKSVALIFDKPSTRTRLACEVACARLGASSVTINGADLQIGRGESLEDSGRVFSQFVDAVCWRTTEQERLTRFATAASIPVINMLSDFEHPCQILSDLAVLRRRFGQSAKIPIAFIGDGANNVSHSWLMAAARLSLDLRIAAPQGYEPRPDILENAREEAARTGATIMITNDPIKAARGARCLYSDVWVSMGQDGERESRVAKFRGYQINSGMLSVAAADAVVMHCLPAHRGEEITSEVMDGPQSIVFEQAQGRLYNAMAVLLWSSRERAEKGKSAAGKPGKKHKKKNKKGGKRK